MDYKRILNFGSMGYHATLDFVRKRDKNTCRKCGKKWLTGHRRFDVHHLNEFEGSGKTFREDHETDKMILLCHKCHSNLPDVRKKMSEGKKKYYNGKQKNVV